MRTKHMWPLSGFSFRSIVHVPLIRHSVAAAASADMFINGEGTIGAESRILD
jgi:hypothetical protein